MGLGHVGVEVISGALEFLRLPRRNEVARYAEKRSPQIYRDLYGEGAMMLLPIKMDSNMAAGNQQKTSAVEFCYKSANSSLEELKNNEIVLFPIQKLLR